MLDNNFSLGLATEVIDCFKKFFNSKEVCIVYHLVNLSPKLNYIQTKMAIKLFKENSNDLTAIISIIQLFST